MKQMISIENKRLKNYNENIRDNNNIKNEIKLMIIKENARLKKYHQQKIKHIVDEPAIVVKTETTKPKTNNIESLTFAEYKKYMIPIIKQQYEDADKMRETAKGKPFAEYTAIMDAVQDKRKLQDEEYRHHIQTKRARMTQAEKQEEIDKEERVQEERNQIALSRVNDRIALQKKTEEREKAEADELNKKKSFNAKLLKQLNDGKISDAVYKQQAHYIPFNDEKKKRNDD